MLVSWTKLIITTIFFLVFHQCVILRNYYWSRSMSLLRAKCNWSPGRYMVTENGNLFKTLVTGYPGVAKRVVYSQMERLVGLSQSDEWPHYMAKPYRPFVKADYPHHEGYWNWGNNMDQTVLVMRNPRYAILEYHDILHDIDYARTAEDAYENVHKLFLNRPKTENYQNWRDMRTIREVHWYGWYIDFWMEGGLLRDVMTHKLTTPEHFVKMLMPHKYEGVDLFERMLGNKTIEPHYSYHCVVDMPNSACEPVSIISLERLLDPVMGPNETAEIAAILEGKQGVDILAPEIRNCIWEELTNDGYTIMQNRIKPSQSEHSYGLSTKILVEMVTELDRLKNKYSAPEWSGRKTAQVLVELFNEYTSDINNSIQTMSSDALSLPNEESN